MRCRFFRLGALALIVTTAAWSQQGGGNTGNTGGGTGGGNTGGGNTGGGRTTGGNTGGNNQTQDPFGTSNNDPFGRSQAQQRPLYLSGTVMLADGSPMTELVTIERICNGQVTPEGYTDSKGRFSFQVGGDPSLAMGDASVSGANVGGLRSGAGGFGGLGGSTGPGAGLGMVNLVGCELRASLPGYRSDIIPLGRRSVFDRPDVGVIVLHPLSGVSGTSISMLTLQAPKKAKKNYDSALKDLRAKEPKLAKAAQRLEAAVAEYPQFAAAWGVLGALRLDMDDAEGARAALKKAIEHDPKYIKPYPTLVRIHVRESEWEEAVDLAEQVLELNPHMTQMHFYRAYGHYTLKRPDEALEAIEAVENAKDAANWPQTHQLRGAIHADRGDYSGAAQSFRQYIAMQPDAASVPSLKKKLNEWEVLGVIEPAKTPTPTVSAAVAPDE